MGENITKCNIIKKTQGKVVEINKEIKFIKLCQKKHLIPTFAKVKLAIKSENIKLQQKLARTIIKTEMQQKHCEKIKTRIEIIELSIDVKDSLGLILFIVIRLTFKTEIESRYFISLMDAAQNLIFITSYYI